VTSKISLIIFKFKRNVPWHTPTCISKDVDCTNYKSTNKDGDGIIVREFS